MGRTILSNAISKMVQPVNENNNVRRKVAINDIAGCLERYYREFFKYDMMKNSDNRVASEIAPRNLKKIVDFINEIKSEINGELLRVACFDGLHNNDELKQMLKTEFDEYIEMLKGNGEQETKDKAKLNVINDFEEMKQTLEDKRLDHILHYPIGGSESSQVGKVVPLVRKHEHLAQWQIDIMSGKDTGFFREATMDGQENGDKKIVDLNKYRHQKDNEER